MIKKHKNLEDALMAFRYSLTAALSAEAKKQGCGLSHFEVIKFVAGAGNPSIKDIAKELHIAPPSASELVEALVKKRLVIRREEPKDRRTTRVLLAPKAHLLLSTLHKKKSSVFNKMLSNLSSNDKTELARILIKCITK